MPELTQYLGAIGVELTQEAVLPDLTLLNQIIAAHLKRFPYQNTALYIAGTKGVGQRTVNSLTADALYTQLITNKQPGYCFQNIELLAWALTSLGFQVNRHLVKLVNKLDDQVAFELLSKEEFSHECLIVELDNHQWLIDTAYANNSLRTALKVIPEQQHIGQEQYRFIFDENNFYLETRTKEGWFCLYVIDKQPKTKEEIQVAHQNLIISPKKFPIRDNFLKMGKVTDEKRKTLVFFKENKQGFFKSINNSYYKNKAVSSIEEFAIIAKEKFDITVDDEVKGLFV
ncbi:arylamine N-acetyltransferase [Legionella clemsonensis]|uniref:Arylamine N-acetyltransferase n=1 Tax=Legionella clemsonensis TaxID=1867846 RepID=A0A222P1T9_9GAMM|nr:arylamine N-acetyltransferase [Legionella clemsonensis]ASQ45828.1 Arylamine N-acetyltransferase [Legionella clemsonensis]